VTLADLSDSVQRKVLQEAQDAIRTTGRFDPDALLRKADFQSLGIKPERSWITRDPFECSRAQNLRQVDAGKNLLVPMDAEGNQGLITALNRQRGPATGDSPYQLGSQALGTVRSIHDSAKAGVDTAYDAWRKANPNATGDGARFVDRLTRSLDEQVVTLPSAWVSRVNKIADGEFPVTANTLEQMRRAAGRLSQSGDGNERMAGALITRAIDDEVANLAGDSQGAANTLLTGAREKAKALFDLKDAVPAMKDVADGKANAEDFVQRYVMGGTVKEVASLWLALGKEGQKAKDAIRAQLVDTLKTKALNAASDEMGNFSPTAYRKALQSVGKEKLQILIGKTGMDELERISRVAGYMKSAPSGSRYNTSGTAGELVNLLGRTSNVPFLGPLISKPARDMADQMAAGRMAQGDRASVAIRGGLSPEQQELLRRYGGLAGIPAGIGTAGEVTR